MSVRPEDTRHWVRKWAKKADDDLKAAEHLMALEDGCPFDIVCFHAQQCAEKYLKALLTFFEADFGKTHNLGYLLEQLPESDLAQALKECDVLIPYAVTTRYPGEWETVRETVSARLSAEASCESPEEK